MKRARLYTVDYRLQTKKTKKQNKTLYNQKIVFLENLSAYYIILKLRYSPLSEGIEKRVGPVPCISPIKMHSARQLFSVLTNGENWTNSFFETFRQWPLSLPLDHL